MLEWVAIPFPEDLSNPGIEPDLLHCGQILYCLSHQGSLFKFINLDEIVLILADFLLDFFVL